jgi:hypothetical protein
VIDTSYDEGKAEGIAEIARQMKLKGIDATLISEITGMGMDEIEKL